MKTIPIAGEPGTQAAPPVRTAPGPVRPAADDAAGEACIHAVFTRQARATPDAIAISHGTTRMTYRQLDERANQVARFLHRNGARPDSLIGVCLEREPNLIVAILGILKAGAA